MSRLRLRHMWRSGVPRTTICVVHILWQTTSLATRRGL